MISVVEIFLVSDGEGFSNVNREEIPHPLVPEQGSRPEMKSSEELTVLSVSEDDAECCLECFNVPLKYGINDYNLTAQVCSRASAVLFLWQKKKIDDGSSSPWDCCMRVTRVCCISFLCRPQIAFIYM